MRIGSSYRLFGNTYIGGGLFFTAIILFGQLIIFAIIGVALAAYAVLRAFAWLLFELPFGIAVKRHRSHQLKVQVANEIAYQNRVAEMEQRMSAYLSGRE